MFEEVLAEQNPHWVGKRYDAGESRRCFGKLLDYLETDQVVAITGVHRAGNTLRARVRCAMIVGSLV